MKSSFFLAFFQATKEAIETLVAFYKSAARKASNHDKAAAVLVQSAEAGDVGGMGMRRSMVETYLVGGLEHFLFLHILGIIIPIDSYFSEVLKPPTR